MADAVKGIEDEFRLARKMKDTCCDESGEETKPAKATKNSTSNWTDLQLFAF